TSEVPDASKISPPVTPKGTRAGHDIDIAVAIDAGMTLGDVKSLLHEVIAEQDGPNKAVVRLKNMSEIPNKDFVLSYKVAGNEVKSGYLVHKGVEDGRDGYLTLILLPPAAPTPEQISPKEMIFVIDRSGSQRGLPITKAKETMFYILDKMNPEDTFQVIDFSNKVNIMFEKPQKKTQEMLDKAKVYIAALEGNGGTWMAPAVEAACATSADANRLRIVVFMTDGYVGNDFEILGLVKKLRGSSRWFPFGTGNSVNRYLIEGMAKIGGGEAEFVLLNSPGEEVASKFYSRISTPVLTDVKVEFDGGEISELFPKQVADVWAQKPLYINARYKTPGRATVTLRGFAAGKPYEQKLDLDLPAIEPNNRSVASVWARAKVDYLMENDLLGAQKGEINPELKEEIIAVALEHRIMTQYTSFVAVEETVITVDGQPVTVTVPVEMPDGVSYEGVFGDQGEMLGKRLRQNRGFGGRSNGPGGGPAGSGGAGLVAEEKSKSGEKDKEPSFSEGEDEDKPGLETRLAKPLQELLEKVEKEGDSRKLTTGDVKVTDGKVVVQIHLNDAGEETMKKLKELGIEILYQAAGAKLVIARVEVVKLKALAALDAVRFVDYGLGGGDKKSELRGVDGEKTK
ncbi:MAG: VWA domain-containing protein, partial [Planctomycetota bacterium]|nr:VWA domain-containing protein [Planctomycetota bacterium]